MNKLYCLKEPFKNWYGEYDVRYVGITQKSLDERLKQHIRDKNNNKRKIDWIDSLVERGLKPQIYLISEYDNRCECEEAEDKCINWFNNRGYDILNISKIIQKPIISIEKEDIDFEIPIIDDDEKLFE